MNAQELRSLLEAHDIRPLKARGQHFLLDEAVIDLMVETAKVEAGDAVVEIGPGPGVLTDALVARGAKVVAVELDPGLASIVASRFDEAQVTLMRRDAREVSNAELLAAFDGATEYKVVANLPYAITSATVVRFLREAPPPTSVTLMVQREVADRIAAEPPRMSALAVTAQTFAKVRKVRNVPAGSFLPPPKVDSAVIHMIRRTDLPADIRPVEAALRLAHLAFGAPRKQLRNSLRGATDQATLEKAFVEAKIDPATRPERMTADDWSRLFAAITE